MTSLTREQKSIIFGSWLGWSLDGYDLVLMLLVIPLISILFFPAEDPTFSLLATFAAYIITLIMRPFGGAFFGNFGDKHGRKKAMIITIMGFSGATFATGLLPTWQMIGFMAPILLIGLRLTQGFFAGGEWGSGAVITMETVPKEKRGILSGFLQSGFNFGFVIASVVFFGAVSLFPEEQFVEIGWRIMFFTGIIPGLVALFVRFRMNESQVWLAKQKQKKTERSPLKKLLSSKDGRKRFIFSLILMTGLMYAYYTSIGFYPTFLQNYVEIEKTEVSLLMIVGTTTSLFGQIFTGYLSQRIGRRKAIGYFAMAAIALAIPTFYGLYYAESTFERIAYTVVLIAVATTGFGPIPAFLSERFPTEVRNSASGFIYNGGLIFGSWAPLIVVTMISKGAELIPVLLGINVIIGSVIILIGAKINPETRDVDISK
ncbi:MFS transporter [Nitrosopumilus ureiphilus]|uniref:MFS transporter n=1 Tax=Nitrosopumilus ureiphilus TaxID=1470067 RepID=A0A7D5RFQ9_9ARCH|nr:MFS transporter [Nitrosopumilus ureiphilus]QLH05925.1 MFS transporter [Nitrosopumilus ureiphilus]